MRATWVGGAHGYQGANTVVDFTDPSKPKEVAYSDLEDATGMADSWSTLGAGHRQRLHGHWGRRRSEIDQEVVAYEPPHTLAWRPLAERLDGKPAPRFAAETVFTIALRAEPGGATHVRLESRQRPASRPRGLVMRLFGRREIAQRLDESLAALRAAVVERPG